jgi:uncharacterized protein involved in outer membrane biogenesis
MKQLRRAVVVFVTVILIVGVVAILGIDAIVKRTVEKEATASLKLSTTMSSARLSILGGKLGLYRLRIGSPKGFSAPDMLEVRKVELAVRYSQLREDPIQVQSLTIDQPRLVIEQSGGALNFKKAADGMPPSSGSQKPIKLIIDNLKVQDAQVIIRPGLPGLAKEITVSVPSLVLKDVGRGRGSQNGAAIKDVTMVVVTALAARAAESNSVPAQLKAILHLNVGQVAGQLGAEVQKHLAAVVPGALGKQLSNIDPSKLAKDPGNALQSEVGGILGGKKNDSAQPAAAGRTSTPPKR